MFLSREDILRADDIVPSITELEVPEWKGKVRIRVMNGLERERFETDLGRYTEKGIQVNIRARLASMCLCDEAGKPIFTEADVAELGKKSCKGLTRVYNAAIEANALGKKGVDELEKNSDPATSGATPTDSPQDTTSPTSTGC